MKELNRELVTYRYGELEITGIYATPVRGDQQEIIPGATITNSRNQDWIFDVADLYVGNLLIEPDYGHQVIRANGEVYQIVAAKASNLENEAPFQYITTTRTRIRIRTNRF